MLASIAAGVVLTAVAYYLAPLVAAPMFGERTAELIQLASPLFLIAGSPPSPARCSGATWSSATSA